MKLTTLTAGLVAAFSLSACGGGSGGGSDDSVTPGYTLPARATTLGEALDQRREVTSITGGGVEITDYPTTGNATYVGVVNMQFQYNLSQDVIDVQGQTTIEFDFDVNDIDGTADNFVVTRGFGVNDEGIGASDPDLDRDQAVIAVNGSLTIDGFVNDSLSSYNVDATAIGNLSFDTPQDGAVSIDVDTSFRGFLKDNNAFAVSSIAFTNDTSLTVGGDFTDDVNVRTQISATAN
jgi:hypothetical protein